MKSKEFLKKVDQDFEKMKNDFIKKNHRLPTDKEIEKLEGKYCLDHFKDFLNTLTKQEMIAVCNRMIEGIQKV